MLLAIVLLLLGVDPRQVQQIVAPPQQGQVNQQGGPPRQVDPEEEKQAHFTKVIFGDTERIWGELFTKAGKTYPDPTLVLFTHSVESACGRAEASVGPFYCPGDSKVYIDLSFYKDMQPQARTQPSATSPALTSSPTRSATTSSGSWATPNRGRPKPGGAEQNKVEANRASVRLELQADYFAGVWAHYGEEKWRFLEPGDIDSAINAAKEIGDDRLQKRGQGYVVPDAFTHGTSKQRMHWFSQGLKTGNIPAARKAFDLEYDEL